jgi:serine/threonine protein phosphatase PrpC
MKIHSNYLVGKSHLMRGELCQDRAAHGEHNNVTYIGVSDGLGSHKYSDIGASSAMIAVRNTTKLFKDWITDSEKTGTSFLHFYLLQFQKLARKIGIDNYKDLSCTLSFALVCNNEYVLFNVGDSPIAIINKDDTYEVISEKDKDFANTTTTILSSKAYESMHVVTGTTENISKIIIFSDGTESILYNSNTNDLAKGLFKDELTSDYIQDLLKYATSVQHDDCSIAVIEF